MGNICCNKGSDNYDMELDSMNQKYYQAGGHANTIVWRDDQLEKSTKESEVLTYQQIFAPDE